MINRIYIIIIIVATAVAFGIGIIVGHFGIKKSTDTGPSTVQEDIIPLKNTIQQTIHLFMNSVLVENLRENLKYLTSKTDLSGTPEALEGAAYIEKRWIDDGLEVYKANYNVLLSYPNSVTQNRVTLKDTNGQVVFQTNGTEVVFDSRQSKIVNPFLAYTPDGNATSRRLFYANYGDLKDLQALADRVGAENLRGSIIIMRYGRIFRGDKVMNAQNFGAAGAILYGDPLDYAPFGIGPDQTYDQKWYLPPSGAQRGSSYTSKGDPLTPVYPSVDYMFREKLNDSKYIPKIPAQPIGYAEALVLLQKMSGDEVAESWKGRLPNVIYRYGGILTDNQTVEINSYNTYQRRNIVNVVGIIKGEVEPDRYVAIGNHRDAWTLGAIDPKSGTSVLLEMTRVLGELQKNESEHKPLTGFRPRRSLIFFSWDSEEYGLIGSVEYVEEYVKVLGSRLVSYLNIDSAVRGNFSLLVRTAPMLFDVIVEAGRMVPSAYDPPGWSIYDKWMKTDRHNDTNEPNLTYGLGSSSDFFAFDQLVGSSNVDVAYVYDIKSHRNIASQPLYHTSYETFLAMEKFIDPTFAAHRTICQFIGALTLLLSENIIIPYNVTRYASVIDKAVKRFPGDRIRYESLQSAANEFLKAAQQFETYGESIDPNNFYETRSYNDQLLQVERAFLNPLGKDSNYSGYKHVVFAPATGNQYGSSGFPAIADALSNGDPINIERQISIAAYFVRGAASTLKRFNQFMN